MAHMADMADMKGLMLWAVAIVAAAGLLVAAGYRSRDPDSALYAKLAADLARHPVSRWIAPEWGGAWNQEGLFREHPAGILWPPALLIKLGFPADQASYVVNMLYQAAAILLIPSVAAVVVRSVEARSLAWLLQLIPLAFVYRIRGNQEHPLLVCFLGLLYGTHRARAHPAWVLLVILAFCALVLIKGVFAVFALAAAGLWLLLIPPPERGSNLRGWAALGAAIVVAAALVAAYEAAYVRATGESFLEFYRTLRLGASISLSDPRVIPHSIGNAGWYALRLLWFAAPWSLAAVAAWWIWLRGPRDVVDRTSAAALLWSVLVVAVFIAALSPALVRAERFVFPAYFIVASVGVVSAIRWSPRIRDVVQAADRYPSLPVTVWFGSFLLSLGSRVLR